MTLRKPFNSFFATLDSLFLQIRLTPPRLLQECCGPLGNCIHAARREREGPTVASVRAGTGTDSPPDQFWHTGPRYSGSDFADDSGDTLTIAAAAAGLHKLSCWASASCCVGSDGRRHVQQPLTLDSMLHSTKYQPTL